MLPFFVVLLLVVALGWFALRIRPRPFPPYTSAVPDLRETIPLPDDLPAPVRRFYQAIIGERVPVIHSAVITLSGTARLRGITMPARARFIHDGGCNYRHYIETTLFGRPVFKVNESYLDGVGRMELPFGVIENDPKINEAANLGLWGEIAVWLPSVLLTDPRVRWEAVDAHTARLIVPFGDRHDSFTVHFDPQTGLLRQLETMRWRDVTDSEKIRWTPSVIGWETFHGIRLPSPSGVMWADQGQPWLVIRIDDIAYNVDVSQYIRARGL